MEIYRHGDVLLAPITSIPENARRKPDLILARGEITGHAHRIEAKGMAQLYEYEDTLFLRIVGSPASVVHEEHLPIELPPGIYRVWRQREYDPVTKGEQWVFAGRAEGNG